MNNTNNSFLKSLTLPYIQQLLAHEAHAVRQCTYKHFKKVSENEEENNTHVEINTKALHTYTNT